MILCETIHKGGQPIGRIFSDTQTGLFCFTPTRGRSPLPEREWRDVDQLKAALAEAYAVKRELGR